MGQDSSPAPLLHAAPAEGMAPGQPFQSPAAVPLAAHWQANLTEFIRDTASDQFASSHEKASFRRSRSTRGMGMSPNPAVRHTVSCNEGPCSCPPLFAGVCATSNFLE